MLTPGPFALPMTSRQAFALEALLKSLPAMLQPQRLALAHSLPHVDTRSDVSWITTETPDRQGDIVLADGMDDSHFRLNPIVTLNHDYARPPVGRSLWRKPARDGAVVGIQAKTYYPPRPRDWHDGPWLPDLALGLVQAGLLNTKSIGFLPLKIRTPTRDEIRANPFLASVRHIVERWLLLEYACCYLPVQPLAVVTEIAKSQLARNAVQLNANYTYQLAAPLLNPGIFSPAHAVLQSLAAPQILAYLHTLAFSTLLCERLQRTYQIHLGLV